jgi:hypothetical protein
MHTGKELEAHQLQKGRLSCDSDAPQVGSARSDSTRFLKVNRRKTNRRKTNRRKTNSRKTNRRKTNRRKN